MGKVDAREIASLISCLEVGVYEKKQEGSYKASLMRKEINLFLVTQLASLLIFYHVKSMASCHSVKSMGISLIDFSLIAIACQRSPTHCDKRRDLSRSL